MLNLPLLLLTRAKQVSGSSGRFAALGLEYPVTVVFKSAQSVWVVGTVQTDCAVWVVRKHYLPCSIDLCAMTMNRVSHGKANID